MGIGSKPADSGGESRALMNARVVSLAELHLIGINASGRLPGADPAFRQSPSIDLRLSRCVFALGSFIVYPKLRMRALAPTPLPLLQLDLDASRVAVVQQKCDVRIGNTLVSVLPNAPELVLANVKSLGNQIRPIRKTTSHYQRERHGQTQTMVQEALEASQNLPSMDVLSTIQPSFLVQTGRPHELRQDSDWKFLSRLRDSISKSTRAHSFVPSWLPSYGHTTSNDISQLLMKSSVAWMIDGETIKHSDLSVLVHLFADENGAFEGTSEPSRTLPSMSMSLQTGFIRVVVRYPGVRPGPDNTFFVRFIFVRCNVETQPFVSQNSVVAVKTAGQKVPLYERVADQMMTRCVLAVDIGDLNVYIFPNLVPLLHQTLHIQRSLFSKTDIEPLEGNESEWDDHLMSESKPLNGILSLDAQVILRGACLQAAAENLVLEFGWSELSLSTMLMADSPSILAKDITLNQAIHFQQVYLTAKELPAARSHQDVRVLAEAQLRNGLVSLTGQHDVGKLSVVRCTVGVKSMEAHIPRSAIRLYHFLEQWQGDYIPGITGLVKTFSPPQQEFSRKRPSLNLSAQLQLSVSTIGMSLQVMHGIWLSWTINNVIAHSRLPLQMLRSHSYTFGLGIESHGFRVSSQSSGDKYLKSADSQLLLSLKLPSLRVSGTYEDRTLSIIILVGDLNFNTKPTHLDTFLSVQQKLGQDFNDFLLLVSDRKRKQTLSEASAPQVSRQPLRTVVSGRMEGFQIGLEGAASTLFFHCRNISTSFGNTADRQWEVLLTDLALSFVPKLAHQQKRVSAEFDHSSRVAFVAVDMQANNRQSDRERESLDNLNVAVTRFHAVFQPSSVGQLGDYVNFIQVGLFLSE